MSSNKYCVIMAGGIGTRFWPKSRQSMPKQFLDILGTGKSFIRHTYERFAKMVPAENFLVVTNDKYKSLVLEHIPEIGEKQVLCEPVGRNTAPCVAYAAYTLLKRNPDAEMIVTPADHLILNEDDFRAIIAECLDFASEHDALMTVGIKPTRPDTGYGYIQADLSLASPRNREIFRVDQFHEKPKREVAEAYLKEKNFFWNAGIFIWSAATIVNAFRVYQPNIAKIFDRIRPMLGTPDEQRIIDEVYPQCENISVDYAIMEKAEEIFVCPSDFGWSDLGTWGSLLLQTPKDVYGNAVIGQNVQLYDSHNCIVHTLEEKRVVIEGLDGYIVAENDDTLLICKLSEEQRIRQFSEEL